MPITEHQQQIAKLLERLRENYPRHSDDWELLGDAIACVSKPKPNWPPIPGEYGFLDYYNGRHQLVIFDRNDDDPALHIRLNNDGTIAEIAVSDEFMPKVMLDTDPSPWIQERDKEEPS